MLVFHKSSQVMNAVRHLATVVATSDDTIVQLETGLKPGVVGKILNKIGSRPRVRLVGMNKLE